MLNKRRKPGKNIDNIAIGEKLSLTETIEDKDLLLYLGLTNDANPLFIQHDFASQTAYQKPIVPTILLTGIITSAIGKYLPGPGSYILKQEIDFHQPVYHYESVTFLFTVIEKNIEDGWVKIEINAENSANEKVATAFITVRPPEIIKNHEQFQSSQLKPI